MGVATCDVTPPVGGRLTGYADRRTPSEGVYLPLRGTAVALTDATGYTLLLVSVEWLGFYNRTAEVRAAVAAATGVPADQVLLCGTHTHCGPALRRRYAPDDCWEDPDEEFLASAFARLASAATAAMAGREPVTLRTATGRCGFAHSRRRPDGQGGVLWAPTLDAPHDHTVPLLLAERSHGRPKHLFFGYACHPTAAGGILEIGGDYPGFAREILESELGCTATFLLGCAGDQKPWRPEPGDGLFPQYPLAEVRRFGTELAAAVMQELGSGRWQAVTGQLQVRSRRLALPMHLLPRSEYELMLGHDNRWFDRWARLNLARLDAGEAPPPDLDFEIQTVRLGDTFLLVAMAGEISAEYGLRLRHEQGGRFHQVWPMGYANEIVGYVPTERQLPEGGYEVIGSQMHLGRPGPLESGTEEKVFAAVGEMLER